MIDDLTPYLVYKGSGVRWFGDVPAHWDVRRLKRICRLAYGDSLPSGVRAEGPVPVLGSNGRVGFHSTANTTAPCIVVGRKGSFGKVNFSNNSVFAIDTTFVVDSRSTTSEIRWLFYLLGWLRLDSVSRDSAVPGLDREDAYQHLLPLPPLAEQAAIVRFLDHADRRIRRYIRAKQRLIALLNEQKQAIIHRAVTRGLDPTAPLKPSGVEWLGDVPAHWEVLPNRALFVEVKEWDRPHEEMLSVTITQGVVLQRELLADSAKKDSSNHDKTAYKLVRPGDIAYNKMRAWQGAVGVSKYQGIVSPAYIVVRLRTTCDPRYYHYLLRTHGFAKEAERWSYGITSDQWSLRSEHFKMIYSTVPPPDEQAAIACYLDETFTKLNAAFDRANREIALLREYRTRLIADVVTGKLDVRAAAARLPDERDEPDEWDAGAGGEALAGGDDLAGAEPDAGAEETEP